MKKSIALLILVFAPILSLADQGLKKCDLVLVESEVSLSDFEIRKRMRELQQRRAEVAYVIRKKEFDLKTVDIKKLANQLKLPGRDYEPEAFYQDLVNQVVVDSELYIRTVISSTFPTYDSYGFRHEELMSAGREAAWDAVRRLYDPERARFSTYIASAIRRKIQKRARVQGMVIWLPKDFNAELDKVKEIVNHMILVSDSRSNPKPNPKEVYTYLHENAEDLGISEAMLKRLHRDKVDLIMNGLLRDISNQLVRSGDSAGEPLSAFSWLPGSRTDNPEVVAKNESDLEAVLAEINERYKDKERVAIKLSSGISLENQDIEYLVSKRKYKGDTAILAEGGHEYTIDEIARIMNYNRESIRLPLKTIREQLASGSSR